MEPIKSSFDKKILREYNKIYAIMKDWGIKPCINGMDDEVSYTMCEFLTKEGMVFQKVPPYFHRMNA